MVNMTVNQFFTALGSPKYITANPGTEGITISGDTANVWNVSISGETSDYVGYHFPNTLINADLKGLNTTNISNMQQMFYGCSLLTTLDLSSFNTSNVTNMYDMFFYVNH